MIDPEVSQILAGKTNFPCRLNRWEGEIIKQQMQLLEDMVKSEEHKSIKRRYIGNICDHEYILLEEYQFREGETVLDIKRAIGVNYYLNRLS